jgi:hypothetical protein
MELFSRIVDKNGVAAELPTLLQGNIMNNLSNNSTSGVLGFCCK